MCFPEVFTASASAGFWVSKVRKICAVVYPLVLVVFAALLLQTQRAMIHARVACQYAA